MTGCLLEETAIIEKGGTHEPPSAIHVASSVCSSLEQPADGACSFEELRKPSNAREENSQTGVIIRKSKTKILHWEELQLPTHINRQFNPSK